MRIVELVSPSCATCRQQTPIVERFKAAHPELKVDVLDTSADDYARGLATQSGLMTAPSFVFLDGERVVYAAAGFQSAARLEAALETAKRMASCS